MNKQDYILGTLLQREKKKVNHKPYEQIIVCPSPPNVICALNKHLATLHGILQRFMFKGEKSSHSHRFFRKHTSVKEVLFNL